MKKQCSSSLSFVLQSSAFAFRVAARSASGAESGETRQQQWIGAKKIRFKFSRYLTAAILQINIEIVCISTHFHGF
jgi:hypothetical protein